MTNENAIWALNFSSFLYLASCFAYIVAISRTGTKIQAWAKFAGWLVLAGFVLHTAGLGIRWAVGGLDRPPWTNLYESLVFFSWGVVLFQGYTMFSWKLPVAGAVAMPLVLILMGMGVMTPNKDVEPLIPALQSNWLKIHVIFGMLSYAGFTMSGCFAYLHLMRNGVSLSKIGAGLAFMAVLNLGLAGGEDVWRTGSFHMARTREATLASGKVVKVKDTSQDYPGGPMVTRMEKVPYATIPFHASWALFAASGLALWFRRRRDTRTNLAALPLSAENAAKRGFDLEGPGPWLFAGAFVALLALLGSIGLGVRSNEFLTFASNPYLVILLAMTAFFALMFLVVSRRYGGFLAGLPSADRLDELGYKNILFGFPFQTLLLITGAIWAYSAWGRSWGWDPKETWALITWLVYLIYLHGKLLLRWKPNALSVLAIVGFVVLVFAFLGVNLVLSGLHSYGST